MLKNPSSPLPLNKPTSLRNYIPLVGCALLCVGLMMPVQGFCNPAAAAADMDNMATNVVDTIFAPWVRKTALALGGGLGVFQSIGAGSFKPFLTWGGIGLLVNFIPKLVSFLSTLGT